MQPANPQGGSILIFVTGQLLVRLNALVFLSDIMLQVDEEQNAQFFSQTFQLFPDGAGNWFVFNDIFRLNYA